MTRVEGAHFEYGYRDRPLIGARLVLGSALMLGIGVLILLGFLFGASPGVTATRATLSVVTVAAETVAFSYFSIAYLVHRCRAVSLYVADWRFFVVLYALAALFLAAHWTFYKVTGLPYPVSNEALSYLFLGGPPGYMVGVILTQIRTRTILWVRSGRDIVTGRRIQAYFLGRRSPAGRNPSA